MIIHNQTQGIIHKTFKGKGLPRRKGPNFAKKDVYKRIISKLTDVSFVKNKLKHYLSIQDDRDRRSILLQEYVPHSYEWRVVKIGNSYFAHKKIVQNNKASGALNKTFDAPPYVLLSFIRELSERLGFSTCSVDLFENSSGYLVNEIQTYFGQALPYLMKINGKIGRYQYIDDQWIFEEGDFNSNHSCSLRLKHALQLLKENKL